MVKGILALRSAKTQISKLKYPLSYGKQSCNAIQFAKHYIETPWDGVTYKHPLAMPMHQSRNGDDGSPCTKLYYRATDFPNKEHLFCQTFLRVDSFCFYTKST